MTFAQQPTSHLASSVKSIIERLGWHWLRMPLDRRFLIGAASVLIPAMLLSGNWVTQLIGEGVVRNSYQPAALYLENFVEPSLQPLATAEQLSAADAAKLTSILRTTSLARVVASFKVWGANGLVLYASNPNIVGRQYPVGSKQLAAWRGNISGDVTRLVDAEHAGERVLQRPLIEIYFPVRERGTDRIIAVAEFYQDATALSHELAAARWMAWASIVALTVLLLAALYGIVRQGSRTIEAQRRSLEARVVELSDLRSDLRMASLRASEHNELFLRRLSADLHDGPAQLVSAALLRLEDSPSAGPAKHGVQLQHKTVRQVLNEALSILRNLASGLAAPDLDAITITDTIELAVKRHREITGTGVQLTIAPLPCAAPAAVKLCAYRFVQEGLNNAWRHAEATGQRVDVRAEASDLVIEVIDRGQGFEWQRVKQHGRLGVRGMGDRIRSLGGSLDIDSRAGHGTTLLARIPIETRTDAEARAA